MRTKALKAQVNQGYCGYLVEFNQIQGSFMIKKGGAFIGWAKSTEAARSIIDLLV